MVTSEPKAGKEKRQSKRHDRSDAADQNGSNNRKWPRCLIAFRQRHIGNLNCEVRLVFRFLWLRHVAHS